MQTSGNRSENKMEALLNTYDISRILRLDIQTVRKMARKGYIPGVCKIGKTWLISEKNLQKYIEFKASLNINT